MLSKIEDLPNIEKLKKILQSLAMLDAILMPEWEYRYFSFDAKWDTDEMMASMKNGEGDEYFILFNNAGAIGKEYIANLHLDNKKAQKVLNSIPKYFSNFINEEAFKIENLSFCFWNSHDAGWISKPISENLPYLKFLTGDTSLYRQWAEEYYEIELSEKVVQYIFEHKALNEDIIKSLNQNICYADIVDDIAEIGYSY